MDSCGNIGTAVHTISVEDRTPPSLSPPHNRTVTCEEYQDPAAVSTAQSHDDCAGNTTTWYEDELRGCSVLRTWKAHDECGNVATPKIQTLKLRVDAPVVHFPGEISISCLDSTESTMTGLPVVGQSNMCGWNVSDVVTVEHTDIVTELDDCHRLISRTWRVADVCGNELSYRQNITVFHLPPVISAPLNVTSSCNRTRNVDFLGQAIVTQSCKSVIVAYDESLDGTALKRRWTGVDSCGRSSLPQVQVITIDEEAPKLIVPSDITILCHEPAHPNSTGWAVLEKDLSESCFHLGGEHPPSIVDYVDSITDDGCPGAIVRQWRATSFLGHMVRANQLIALSKFWFLMCT